MQVKCSQEHKKRDMNFAYSELSVAALSLSSFPTKDYHTVTVSATDDVCEIHKATKYNKLNGYFLPLPPTLWCESGSPG